MAFLGLIAVVVLLPAAITYCHLEQRRQTSHIAVVSQVTTNGGIIDGDTASTTGKVGLYRASSTTSYFRQITSEAAWPSVGLVGSVVAPPTSGGIQSFFQLVVDVMEYGDDSATNFLQHDSKIGKWCISGKGSKLCSSSFQARDHPTSGMYYSYSSSGNTTSALQSVLQVKYIAAPSKTKFKIGIEREPFSAEDFIITKTATAILAAIILGVAYLAPNTRDVSIIYENIVNHGERWRMFTGSFAHGNGLHLGMNCLSLYSLGTDLEESFGSIPFLMYNVSLIPLTLCLTFLLTKHRRMGQQSWRRQQLVGFSAVLFVWSTVASLRLPICCPLPMLPNFTVKTYNLRWGLKFNAGPFIRAAVVEVLYPNSSREGHLAGIIMGLLLHSGFLPLWLVQPALLLPAMLLGELYYCRKVLPVPVGSGIGPIPSRDVALKQLVLHHLSCVEKAFLVVLPVSASVLEKSLVLQLLLVAVTLHYAIQCQTEETKAQTNRFASMDSRRRSAIIFQALWLVLIVAILSDAMSFGGLFVAKRYWIHFLDRGDAKFCLALLVLVVRLSLQTMALVLVTTRLRDLSVSMGAAACVFSGPISYATEAGDGWIQYHQKTQKISS